MLTHKLWTKIRKYEYPSKPQFKYIKVGFKGASCSWTYYPDDDHCMDDFSSQE